MMNGNARIAKSLMRLAKELLAAENDSVVANFIAEFDYQDANKDINTVEFSRGEDGLKFKVEFIPDLAGLVVSIQDVKEVEDGKISAKVVCKYWFEQSFYKHCSWQPDCSPKEKSFEGDAENLKTEIGEYIASFTNGLTIKK